jgi:hypothetical protein
MYLPAFADLAKGYRLNKKGFYKERLFLLDCIKLGMASQEKIRTNTKGLENLRLAPLGLRGAFLRGSNPPSLLFKTWTLITLITYQRLPHHIYGNSSVKKFLYRWSKVFIIFIIFWVLQFRPYCTLLGISSIRGGFVLLNYLG